MHTVDLSLDAEQNAQRSQRLLSPGTRQNVNDKELETTKQTKEIRKAVPVRKDSHVL